VIEAVPNLSEGRSKERIERIASTVVESGCRLLDLHSDPDHNRSVLTIVGEPDRLVEAVVALAGAAIEAIDIRRHRGVHPRVGSLDVVPFVPLAGLTLDEAVLIARRAGSEIANRHGIPVYLYGAASPAGRDLPAIRKGGLRGLVAYNVLLDTDDLEIGRRIASAIREKGGGLPGVRALPFYLKSRGLVQVSMNLTDVDATPIPRAFAFVRDEAERYGVKVVESEIVGLVPRRALKGATAEEILARRDPAELILEERV